MRLVFDSSSNRVRPTHSHALFAVYKEGVHFNSQLRFEVASVFKELLMLGFRFEKLPVQFINHEL